MPSLYERMERSPIPRSVYPTMRNADSKCDVCYFGWKDKRQMCTIAFLCTDYDRFTPMENDNGSICKQYGVRCQAALPDEDIECMDILLFTTPRCEYLMRDKKL
jgi:hypothetical protein